MAIGEHGFIAIAQDTEGNNIGLHPGDKGDCESLFCFTFRSRLNRLNRRPGTHSRPEKSNLAETCSHGTFPTARAMV